MSADGPPGPGSPQLGPWGRGSEALMVEWGEGVFGIGAASVHYFGVSPENLSREQAAILAAALPAPKCFDKTQYCRRANFNFPARQDFILENMDRVALAPVPQKAASR